MKEDEARWADGQMASCASSISHIILRCCRCAGRRGRGLHTEAAVSRAACLLDGLLLLLLSLLLLSGLTATVVVLKEPAVWYSTVHSSSSSSSVWRSMCSQEGLS